MNVIKALRFSDIGLPNSHLKLHLTSCPGVRFFSGKPVCGIEFLAEDLGRLEARNVRFVLSCLTHDELRLGVECYANEFARRGMVWRVVPIADMSVPSATHDAELDRALDDAKRIIGDGMLAIHCMGGLGRTGTVSARFAMADGMTADQAIRFIRASHDVEAIETADQERYLWEREGRLL